MSYLVTLASAGCLPDSALWPVAFDTAREAWDFVAEEVDGINDDGDFLAAHTALHSIDRDKVGSIPAGENTLYAYHVEVA